jgi:hypothetical protein
MANDRGTPPPPPSDLRTRPLPLLALSPAAWSRVHRATLSPCFYSEDPANRFSSRGVGVLYLADAAETAFWEIYWDDLGPLAPDERRIPRAKLNQRVVRAATPKRRLQVFDATNRRSLRAVSATAGTFTSTYDVCQVWAKALATHPHPPDGILYPSARNAGARCLALFASRTRCDDIGFGAATKVGDSVEILASLLAEGVGVLAS